MTTALLLLLGTIAPCAAVDDQRVPQCGIAAIYGVATLLSIETSPSQIETLIRQRQPDADLSALSLKQIVDGFEDLGVPAKSFRAVPGSYHSLPTPSVIYFRPERLSSSNRKVGHVVVLTAINSEVARVLDLTHSREPIEIPLAELNTSWDGEYVAITRDGSRLRMRSFLWIAGAVLALFVLRRSLASR